MRQNRQYLFSVSYLEFFEVPTGNGVDVSIFFGVGAGAESEKCDSAHLCFTPIIP